MSAGDPPSPPQAAVRVTVSSGPGDAYLEATFPSAAAASHLRHAVAFHKVYPTGAARGYNAYLFSGRQRLRLPPPPSTTTTTTTTATWLHSKHYVFSQGGRSGSARVADGVTVGVPFDAFLRTLHALWCPTSASEATRRKRVVTALVMQVLRAVCGAFSRVCMQQFTFARVLDRPRDVLDALVWVDNVDATTRDGNPRPTFVWTSYEDVHKHTDQRNILQQWRHVVQALNDLVEQSRWAVDIDVQNILRRQAVVTTRRLRGGAATCSRTSILQHLHRVHNALEPTQSQELDEERCQYLRDVHHTAYVWYSLAGYPYDKDLPDRERERERNDRVAPRQTIKRTDEKWTRLR